MPHDPELAERMSRDDFDPHIEQAVAMGTVSREEGEGYVKGQLDPETTSRVSSFREEAKPVNYLSAYGGTWKALQRQTGWSEERCKAAIESYWEANWSIKAIADEQVTIKDYRDRDWIVSPLNGMIVNLRSEKDRFNAVAQSGGAFYHFNWIFNIINIQKEKWGKATLTANIHKLIVDTKPIELLGS